MTLLGNEEGIPVDMAKMMTAFFGRIIVSGLLNIPEEVRVTEKYPEIRLTTVGELLEKAWATRV